MRNIYYSKNPTNIGTTKLGVQESTDHQEKKIKRNVWIGRLDKNIMLNRLKIPDVEIVAKGALSLTIIYILFQY